MFDYSWTVKIYFITYPWTVNCILQCKCVFYLSMHSQLNYAYVSLRLRMQNWRKNGISRLISALCINCLISIPEYSRIIDYSIIWMCIWCGLLQKLYKIKKSELLNSKVYSKCKRYISNNSRIFQKISERWVLKNLDIHLEQTISELELRSEKSKIGTFPLEFNGQVLVRQD